MRGRLPIDAGFVEQETGMATSAILKTIHGEIRRLASKAEADRIVRDVAKEMRAKILKRVRALKRGSR